MPEAQVADPTGALAWDLKTRLFAAHFTEGETISDPDRLARLAVAAGLDDAVARASQLGIRGVPFFVLADSRLPDGGSGGRTRSGPGSLPECLDRE